MRIPRLFRCHVQHDTSIAGKKATASAFSCAFTGNVHRIKNSYQKLIGLTIRPQVATELLSKVAFDGHGKIVSFRTPLDEFEYHTLTDNIIPALEVTPAKNNNTIRTPLECLMKVASVIDQSSLGSEEKQNILKNIKHAFLAGNVSASLINSLHHYLNVQLPHQPGLLAELQTVIGTLEKEFFITKHNDNYFGRLFETELTRRIVSAPSEAMITNIRIIRNVILKDFTMLDSQEQKDVCTEVLKNMKYDPATWRGDIPEVKAFMKKNSAANFLKMVKSNSPLRHVLLMHLTVKYLCSSAGFQRLNAEALQVYRHIIKPQRHIDDILDTNVLFSNRTGIQLPYQVGAHGARTRTRGIRPIDRYALQVQEITEHNRLALGVEKPMGIGMSGSANLLNRLFLAIAHEREDFNLAQARLFAASFLTYSGGHSINEAYTVYGYLDTLSLSPITYNLLGGDATTREAVSYAWDKVLAAAAEL